MHYPQLGAEFQRAGYTVGSKNRRVPGVQSLPAASLKERAMR